MNSHRYCCNSCKKRISGYEKIVCFLFLNLFVKNYRMKSNNHYFKTYET